MGKKIVAFFKRFIIPVIGAISFIVSFIASIWMHDKVYGDAGTSFSKLRGGPAIGTALVSLASFANVEALRTQAESESRCMTMNEILLGLTMAFLSVGAGVLGADMRRGWKKENK